MSSKTRRTAAISIASPLTLFDTHCQLSSFCYLCRSPVKPASNILFAGRKRKKDTPRLPQQPLKHHAFHTNHPTTRNQDVNTGQKRPTRRSHRAPKTSPRTPCAFTHWMSTPRFPSHAVGLPLAQRRTTRCHSLLLPSIHP
jgi:hypothetical protein